jgi:phosphatidylglycerophosphatase A
MSASPIRRTPSAWTVATFIGIGNLRPGPGTWASVATVLLWMAAARYIRISPNIFIALTAIALIVVTAIGIPASTITAREAGRDDPGFVVIDEVAGQLFALLALSPTWLHAAIALALFRLFDIAKPWPIRRLERLHGGTGIMLDDIAAGCIAFICAHLLTHFIPALV